MKRKRKRAVTMIVPEMLSSPPPPTTTPIPITGPRESQETKEKGSYEKLREERIKENLERIQKLGIIELTVNLKSYNARRRNVKPPPIAIADVLANDELKPPPPPRRSSRYENRKLNPNKHFHNPQILSQLN